MPLDTSIALQTKPIQFENPLDVQSKLMTLSQLSGQRQLQDMQIQQTQQAQQQDRTLADIYRTGGMGADGQPNHNAVVQQMAAQGLGKMIPAYLKQVAEAQKAQADVSHLGAQTTKLGTENTGLQQDQQIKAHTQSLRQLGGVNSPDALNQWMLEGVKSGAVSPDKAAGMAQQLQQSPDAWQTIKGDLLRTGQSIQQQIEANTPKLKTVMLGGRAQVIDENAQTTKTGAGSSFDITQDANNIATNARMAADSAAGRSVTMRGQDLTDSRQRDKNVIDEGAVGKVDWKQDTDGNWIGLPKNISSAGPVTPVATTAPGKREVQAGHALDVIAEARKEIPKATGSYIGAGVDAASRAFGSSTGGSLATAKLKAIEGALMMAQPRMEGPQSDKDVMLYRQMAGQIGDPTVPQEQKTAALDAIENLHGKYTKEGKGAPKIGATATAAKPAGAVVPIKSDKDYSALPSGTRFQAPDGSIRVKP